MKISIASDHGAYALKEHLKPFIESLGHKVVDFGTYSTESCDYPQFIAPAAHALANGEVDRAIVLCTTGIGASIVANKVEGVRCALVHDSWSAVMTRRHNNTNALAIGAGVTGPNLAEQIVSTWLVTDFDGGRHQRRVDQITAVERGEL